MRFLFEWFGTARRIDLDKLHHTIHPGSVRIIAEGWTPKADNDVGACALDFATANLDHSSDRDRLIAADIQNSFENQVGIQAGGAKRRRVTRLEGQ